MTTTLSGIAEQLERRANACVDGANGLGEGMAAAKVGPLSPNTTVCTSSIDLPTAFIAACRKERVPVGGRR